jgi:ankyrin repeat protein
LGKTALDLAAHNKKKDLLELLRLDRYNDKDIYTVFSRGVYKSNMDIIELLLPEMTPEVINQANTDGEALLHYAARRGDKDVVGLLLAKDGIDVNKADKNGLTALHGSVDRGDKDVVGLLLDKYSYEYKVDVNQADKDGWTALRFAVAKGHKDLVDLLVNKGADLNQADKEGRTALHYAAKSGETDLVALLLAKDGIDVNKADNHGKTALHYAAENGHKDIVGLLLPEMTPDAINQANTDGLTALDLAARRGDKDIVGLLLAKMTPDAVNQALHYAAESGRTKLVKWMIEEKGAAVNQADRYGLTALHFAAYVGHKDVVEILLAKDGIDVNKADKDGLTALHYAADKGRKELVELLVNKGADLNQANTNGLTALHFAARLGHHDTVELLIESGKCDLNAKDREGHDIWTYYPPDQEASIGMVELLMKHGAKYPEPKSDGELAKIVSSSQAAHSQGKLAQEEYNKFKEGKKDANIKVQLEAQANEFIELLNAAHLSLSEEDHINMVKDLIGPKYADIKQGQGRDFIEKVGKICGVEESQLNPENLKSAIDNLSEEKRKELAKYSQDKITATINHYTTNDSKPFHDFDVTTKDFFGVFGAKIAEKIEKKEDIGDILPNTLKEILDAGTMYGSGGASCATGMVNKMFNSSPQLFEDKSEVVKKESFEFEGFVVDYEALLTVATMKLRDSKEEELVKKILDQSELTPLEVQKVGAKVYEVLKATKNDGNLVEGYKNSLKFSEIVHYGEENVFTDAPKKIEQFGKEIDYKTLSDQTYSGLFKKHGEKYAINQDKVRYPLTADDLEPSKPLYISDKKDSIELDKVVYQVLKATKNDSVELDSIIKVLSGHIPESGSSQTLLNPTSKDRSRGRG